MGGLFGGAMERIVTIRVDLPAANAAPAILESCVAALLERLDGLAAPAALAAEIRAAAQAARQPAAEAGGRWPVTLSLQPDPARLAVEAGAWRREYPLPGVELPAAPPTPERGAGLGMGLYIVRKLADDVVYHPQADGNRWRVAMPLPGDLQLPRDAVTDVRLDLPADFAHLSVLGAAIRAILAQAAGLPDPAGLAYRAELAAQEVGANIVAHAYAGQATADDRIQATVSLASDPSRLIIETHDTGRHTFDLAAAPDPSFPASPPGSSLLSSSALLFASTTIVNAGNYLFNLILGRWLGPADFADLSLIVTLFLLVTFVAATLQTVAAKYAAVYAADGDAGRIAGLRGWLSRNAWVVGLAALVLVAAGSPLLQRFFKTGAVWPFVLLAAGLPFYFAQAVDRGVLQGQTRFGLLTASYQAEMWVRLAFGLGFVAIGWSVNGAVGGLTLSLIATWLVARRARRGLPGRGDLPAADRRAIIAFAGPVSAALVGQILINNSDILIVKHFYEAAPAGHYAALALIGRIVFFATWSVVTVLFPIVAQRQQRGERHHHLLALALGLVATVSALIVGATLLFPELIIGVLFGAAYLSVAPLLWLYAVGDGVLRVEQCGRDLSPLGR